MSLNLFMSVKKCICVTGYRYTAKQKGGQEEGVREGKKNKE